MLSSRSQRVKKARTADGVCASGVRCGIYLGQMKGPIPRENSSTERGAMRVSDPSVQCPGMPLILRATLGLAYLSRYEKRYLPARTKANIAIYGDICLRIRLLCEICAIYRDICLKIHVKRVRYIEKRYLPEDQRRVFKTQSPPSSIHCSNDPHSAGFILA